MRETMRGVIIVMILTIVGGIFAQTLFKLTFENEEVGKFPSGWSSKDKKNMRKVYSVREENGERFLRAESGGLSVTIGYEKEWNLVDYPLLSWRWRPMTFPVGTDERQKSGNDNVLGVYVVFGGWPVPKAIKYIWSETLPVGTELPSPFSGRTRMVVIRSGKEGRGEWFKEERNVLEDYRRLFKDPNATPKAKGLALLTDSDNTETEAVGDYDDIEIMKKGIKEL
jgi:hypothetical protein